MDGTRRKISKIIEPQAVVEGAGVRLKRSIGTRTLDYLDPFLLLDHFQSKNPADYQAGFPLHPHRGIETVTYLLAGAVRHRDSVGNAGEIGPGDLQWMTAGRGIMHEEMPQVRPEGVSGFQLWVNLPKRQKMIAPRYQNVNANEIAEIKREGGAKIRVIAGKVDGVVGPISGIAAEPTYLDVVIAPHGSFSLPIPRGHSAFAYVFEGEGKFASSSKPFGVLSEKQVDGEEILFREPAGDRSLVLFDAGDEITVQAGERGIRFLLVSGKPIQEPVAWYGPIVMNTQAELQQAVSELRNGTFIKA